MTKDDELPDEIYAPNDSADRPQSSAVDVEEEIRNVIESLECQEGFSSEIRSLNKAVDAINQRGLLAGGSQPPQQHQGDRDE